ncbi:MAG: hypothetical protein LBC41_14990 [Clostridiales bacterium]|jgi:hypothetical protein|nr:hypothetical protein [Clostridiales bacterium]MDR2751959.1 hypothetical protein [Clostridiales bacterium]
MTAETEQDYWSPQDQGNLRALKTSLAKAYQQEALAWATKKALETEGGRVYLDSGMASIISIGGPVTLKTYKVVDASGKTVCTTASYLNPDSKRADAPGIKRLAERLSSAFGANLSLKETNEYICSLKPGQADVAAKE